MRLTIYDAADKAPASRWWLPGAAAYRFFHKTDDYFGAESWPEALEWILRRASENKLKQIEYWGHGGPGYAALNGEVLDRDTLRHQHIAPLLGELRAHLPSTCIFWLRTCASFHGVAGRVFAEHLAKDLGCTVAAHTFIIGPYQSGLHTLAPGEEADWSAKEGLREDGTRAWSTPRAPRTIFAWRNSIPEGW